MAGFPKPRRFIPRNPKKYKGDPTKIVSRSSWETKFMIWCDTTTTVVMWNSEETIIPYVSPLDGEYHRYFIDFAICIRSKSGALKKYLVEVKPESQTVAPVKGRKRESTYLKEVQTWMVNQAKWEAATKLASQKGYEFVKLTEKHLGIS